MSDHGEDEIYSNRFFSVHGKRRTEPLTSDLDRAWQDFKHTLIRQFRIEAMVRWLARYLPTDASSSVKDEEQLRCPKCGSEDIAVAEDGRLTCRACGLQGD